MAWARIDDAIIDHPKVLEAGEDARDLLIVSIIWCNKHLTDGRVPKAALGVLSRKKSAEKTAAALVRVGLWHDEGDAWRLHDYLDWNPSREEVEAKRNASAERMRKSRERRAKKGAATNAQVAESLQRNTRATDASVTAPTPLHSLSKTPLPPAGGGTPGSSEPPDDPEAIAVELRVLSRINDLAGTTYTSSPDLRARIREGVTEAQLLAVVESQWARDFMQEKPGQRFRPRTLFSARNFAEYLGGASAKPKPEAPDRSPGTERYFS